MGSSVIVFIAFCLGASTTFAQLNPLLLGEDFLGENGGGIYNYYLYNNLQNSIRRQEMGVRSGAIGGCESGVVGPINSLQPTASIRFRSRFLTPPTLSLAVSDMTVGNIALPLNFRIRPIQISATGAQVGLTDITSTLATLQVSYMACPGAGPSGSRNGF